MKMNAGVINRYYGVALLLALIFVLLLQKRPTGKLLAPDRPKPLPPPPPPRPLLLNPAPQQQLSSVHAPVRLATDATSYHLELVT